MAWPSKPLLRATRGFTLVTVLVTIALLSACDGGADDENGDAPPEATASAPAASPTDTTPPGAGTEPNGQPSNGSDDYGEAYDRSLQMALDEDLGSDINDQYLASVDIDIKPNGEGLPEGSGLAEQGAEIYASQCASCHGQNGEGGGPGGDGPRLIIENAGPWEPGDDKVIGNYWPYATTVYDYARRAMPFFAPGSLTDDEYYAVTAYLLSENGVIAVDEEMNAETLPQVEMPNRDNFFSCWPDECRPDVEGGTQAD